MLRSVFALIITSFIAGVLGFSGIASAIADIAKLIFYVAIIFLFIAFIDHLFRNKRK